MRRIEMMKDDYLTEKSKEELAEFFDCLQECEIDEEILGTADPMKKCCDGLKQYDKGLDITTDLFKNLW